MHFAFNYKYSLVHCGFLSKMAVSLSHETDSAIPTDQHLEVLDHFGKKGVYYVANVVVFT